MSAEIGTIQNKLLIILSVLKINKELMVENKKIFTGTKLYEIFNNSNEKKLFLTRFVV